MTENPLIADIDAILPQTQCRRCGFPGCRPYAISIVEGRAAINQCAPGGEEGVRKIAAVLGVNPVPLDTSYSHHMPKAVAFIDEQACIGCTLCIQVCPVDAIVGAKKLVHTVIGVECTGCYLCVEPCPMDCIIMEPVSENQPSLVQEEGNRHAADRARARYQLRTTRLERLEREKQERTQKSMTGKDTLTAPTTTSNAELKKAVIQLAMARAMAAHARHDITSCECKPSPGES